MSPRSTTAGLGGYLKSILEQTKGGVLIVGLGSHACATARLLRADGCRVRIVERAQRSAFDPHSLKELEQSGVELHFDVDGEQAAALGKDFTACAVSPAVSRESAVFGALRRLPLTFVSELEIALARWPGRLVAVTGSNGKSTTAALTAHLLAAAGLEALRLSAADPGFVEQVAERAEEAGEQSILVVDIPGYELDFCSSLKPAAAIFLNLFDKDLERYGSEARSFAMKRNAFANLTPNELAVINRDDRWGLELMRATSATIRTFGAGQARETSGVEIQYQPQRGIDVLCMNGAGTPSQVTIKNRRLCGLHNRYNAAAALLAAAHFGVSPADIESGIAAFVPLPHRLELLPGSSGPACINDSRSTSVGALMAACRAVHDEYPDRPFMLLIGGRARAGSWLPVMEELQKKWQPREVVCFGEDGRLLANHCHAAGLSHHREDRFAGAVRYALGKAGPGDLVLLSPGCASFDEFTDFEERGNTFKLLVSPAADTLR